MSDDESTPRRPTAEASAMMRAKMSRTMSAVGTQWTGKTKLRKAIKAGAEEIEVWSSLSLFGSKVEQVREDGRVYIRMVNPRHPLTVQIGRSLAVNVYKIDMNTLYTTPISVKEAADQGAEVFFGSGPAVMAGDRLDMDALKKEVEALEQIEAVYAPDSAYGDHEKESKEAEEEADAYFWEAIIAERSHRVERLLYCPLIDADADLDFTATTRFKDALRVLNRCIKLDQTRISAYAKRGAVLCKLKWFDRALEDARNYVNIRPESPTGHCLVGVAQHGMLQYNKAIESLKNGMVCGDVAYYDKSRVWSTGTHLGYALSLSIKKRDALIHQGKNANAQGMQWCAIGKYGEALHNLVSAVDATADALGKQHLSYATTVNNVGACLESMGRYDDAMKKYQEALKITEKAAPAVCKVFAIAARHLPLVSFSEGEEKSSHPYLIVEHKLLSQSGLDSPTPKITKVLTNVKHNSLQPVWNASFTIESDSAYSQLNCSLWYQHPLKAELGTRLKALEASLEPLKEREKAALDELEKLRTREARLQELRKLKAAELAKCTEAREEKDKELQGIADEIKKVEREIVGVNKSWEAAKDKRIGGFMFDLASLAEKLEGQEESVSATNWFEVVSENGELKEKVRGEDFGVSAVQMEVWWQPESAEYATRLGNIGNLRRVMGDTFTSRGGGHNEIRKMDSHYEEGLRYLEAALESMVAAKSAIRRTEEERALLLGKEATKIDGSQTREACVVMENLGRLLVSRSLKQKQPKGATAAAIAHFENVARESGVRGLEVLDKALALRGRLSGEDSKEVMEILVQQVLIHMEMDNFKDALTVQERVVELSTKVHGEGSEQWTRHINTLNEVHHGLGDTCIRTLPEGRWKVDTEDAWHWNMVPMYSKKVGRAAAAAHQRVGEEDEAFKRHEAALEVERIRLYDPPKIEDFHLSAQDDPLVVMAQKAAAKLREARDGARGETKVGIAVASKRKTPDVALVRHDCQSW
eukprot:CAMPEP_0114178902 /NCGR_PEP_ID=MMETSP0043_2-20121206/38790_1 /TAXON_ID=464988 /ORGANISM="Hemiselmis andersenii, Strain CCMP644" /LENGTH=986 /DNA_ID=CAMNT_0001277343 /DNA_START=178 /DNA_END=3136 /DNA_ORIENTATION=+